MSFLARAAALFSGVKLPANYHASIEAGPVQEAKLLAARKEIRAAIKSASIRIEIEDALWQGEFASARSRPTVMPKFFTQGSVAYRLLVDPCHQPPQQLDLDDGMYVRVDHLEDGRPALVAKALFEFVEAALRPLCTQRGWKLIEKDVCIRVQLDATSHVDIPIYSVPRDIAELADTAAFIADAERMGRIAKRAGKTYAILPADKIMLAHRDGTWQQSDPLELQRWVDACVARYGEQFRRACRYLKGWRDFQFRHCCLSSIVIMAAVERAMAKMNGAHRGFGDDRLVFEIAQLLPGIFDGPIENPVLPGSGVLLNDWTEEQRAEMIAAAESLRTEMQSALKGTAHADLVVAALRRAFGSRIPNRPDVVEILPVLAAAVGEELPATVPSPKVSSSTSG